MSRVVLLISVLFLLFISSCSESPSEKEGNKTEKESHMDSLSVAEVITENFDTTGVPLYFIPEEFTETTEKETYSIVNGEEISVNVIMYCQTKEGGIEVNYQLKSGAKFRIHYRDWAGRIVVSKGDSIASNYSFDKKDYNSLKDSSFWNDKVLSDLWISKFDSKNESIKAMFTVASPYDLDKAELDGITIQVVIDSMGKAELTEAL